MWVALLVVLVMSQTGTASIGVQTAPEPFHSEAECKASIASVELQVKNDPRVKGYHLRCVEISKEDFKAAGKEA